MAFAEKYRSDVILGLLYIESMLLTLVLANKLYFWLLFILSFITVFLYMLMFFGIELKKFLEYKKRDDILFILFITAFMNANIAVFGNHFILALVFLAYFLGLRYLAGMFKKGSMNQIQKNALNLSVLLAVFLGTNILVNLEIILQKYFGDFAVLTGGLSIFAFIYLLSFYNFAKNRITKKWTKAYSTVLAFLITEISLAASFYLERYPSIYKVENTTSLSIVTLPLFTIVIYYLVYGLMIHKLEERFTSRVIIEYLSVSSVIFFTLFVTIRWFGS